MLPAVDLGRRCTCDAADLATYAGPDATCAIHGEPDLRDDTLAGEPSPAADFSFVAHLPREKYRVEETTKGWAVLAESYLHPDTPAGEPSPAAGDAFVLADHVYYETPDDAPPYYTHSPKPAQNPVTPMVVGADGRDLLASHHCVTDECDACGSGLPWPPGVRPGDEYQNYRRANLARWYAAHTPPAQQPAGPDVDLPRSGHGVRSIQDLLDAREAEIRGLRAARDTLDQWCQDMCAERDDARARLAEIRALCDEREDAFRQAAGDWEHTEEAIALSGGVISTQRIRAVLDREAGDP